MREAASGADLLVHEATFLERDRALAIRSGHSTAADAARLAAGAGVGLLALVHRSSRYPREEVLAEARAVFAATVAPRDLDLIRVPLSERGPARLLPGRRDGGLLRPGRSGAAPGSLGSGPLDVLQPGASTVGEAAVVGWPSHRTSTTEPPVASTMRQPIRSQKARAAMQRSGFAPGCRTELAPMAAR